ncbi:hypothetical protein [Actinomyces faecalis]|uniref:hypothetical protein n=1 Tax=Actinomyces faecalis TaxID=2722820 RepID=UPI0015534FAB|nr:hypothetical protein [Actinomyces faecalis]
MPVPAQRAGAGQRLERARQALQEAERRAGVSSVGERALRRAASGAGRAASASSVQVPESLPLLGAWQALERDLDAGWGGVLCLRGSLWLLLALAARRQAAHGWCAVVGGQDVGWCAAAEAGLALERTLVVPLSETGAGARGALLPAVLGALVDGVEVVVLTSGSCEGLRREARRALQARARERGVLVLAQGEWEGGRQVQAHLTGCGTGEVVRVLREQPCAAQEVPAGYLTGLGWRVRDPRSGAVTGLRLGPQGLYVEGAEAPGPEGGTRSRPALALIEGGAS